uniref:VPS13_C domain-containing protein n=1 Tax=Toxocara canis TaxID=6265 RepID=A0A183V7Z1_TOXCA
LSRLQVDNQLANCVFPTIVAVVPPPKSIVADNVPKPFAEFSVAICQSEHSSLVQVKYLHLLIQEFAVRIDEGIINALVTFLGSEVQPHSYNRDAFEKDLAMTTHSYVSQVASNTRVHVSFSKGGTSEEKSKMTKGIYIQSEFINVILNSIGITLTEVDDAVFNHQQLQNEILSHYLKQAIKQLHVLIFGLDVIGNPYGLVRDLSSGVQDFFYQPYKGAIKGPEEFAGGVRQGVRGLFGATVGGASGAVSRITGTLGKGLATLACDEEYARRRQRMFNERSRGISGTVACGAEGVGRGFCEGVAGIVAKPIEGARTGGVGGFARGVGKGVIGAAVRPVSGVVDFASCSFGALKTAAIGAEEVQQLRPPRVILIDKIIRPYSAEQSLGAKIFRGCGALEEGSWRQLLEDAVASCFFGDEATGGLLETVVPKEEKGTQRIFASSISRREDAAVR